MKATSIFLFLLSLTIGSSAFASVCSPAEGENSFFSMISFVPETGEYKLRYLNKYGDYPAFTEEVIGYLETLSAKPSSVTIKESEDQDKGQYSIRYETSKLLIDEYFSCY